MANGSCEACYCPFQMTLNDGKRMTACLYHKGPSYRIIEPRCFYCGKTGMLAADCRHEMHWELRGVHQQPPPGFPCIPPPTPTMMEAGPPPTMGGSWPAPTMGPRPTMVVRMSPWPMEFQQPTMSDYSRNAPTPPLLDRLIEQDRGQSLSFQQFQDQEMRARQNYSGDVQPSSTGESLHQFVSTTRGWDNRVIGPESPRTIRTRDRWPQNPR